MSDHHPLDNYKPVGSVSWLDELIPTDEQRAELCRIFLAVQPDDKELQEALRIMNDRMAKRILLGEPNKD